MLANLYVRLVPCVNVFPHNLCRCLIVPIIGRYGRGGKKNLTGTKPHRSFIYDQEPHLSSILFFAPSDGRRLLSVSIPASGIGPSYLAFLHWPYQIVDLIPPLTLDSPTIDSWNTHSYGSIIWLPLRRGYPFMRCPIMAI